MNDVDSLLDGLRSAYAKIAEVEKVASSHPNDPMVLMSLGSVKAHAEQLERECARGPHKKSI